MSLGVALAVTLPFAVLTIFLMRLVLKSRGWKQTTGREQLIGEEGEATAGIRRRRIEASRGMVRVHGELWRAVSRQAIPAGRARARGARRWTDAACRTGGARASEMNATD